MVFASNCILLWDPVGIVSCKSANARQSNCMDGPGWAAALWKIANQGAAEYYSGGNFRGETKTSERLKVKQSRNNTSKTLSQHWCGQSSRWKRFNVEADCKNKGGKGGGGAVRPQTPHDGNVLATAAVSRFAATTEAVATSLDKARAYVHACVRCDPICIAQMCEWLSSPHHIPPSPHPSPKKGRRLAAPDLSLTNDTQAMFAQFPLDICICLTVQ